MSPTIVVVEDDPVISNLLVVTLELEGWTVLQASDAASALELIKSTRPDLVLSDVMMPGRSGLELCDDIDVTPETHGIPVVLLSARALPAEVAAGFTAGAVDYVTKPFDPDDLIERLRRVLDGHPPPA
jgi:DNA-binding response OmpR family regulator